MEPNSESDRDSSGKPELKEEIVSGTEMSRPPQAKRIRKFAFSESPISASADRDPESATNPGMLAQMPKKTPRFRLLKKGPESAHIPDREVSGTAETNSRVSQTEPNSDENPPKKLRKSKAVQH